MNNNQQNNQNDRTKSFRNNHSFLKPFFEAAPAPKSPAEMEAVIQQIMKLKPDIIKTREDAIAMFQDGIKGDWYNNETYTAIIREAEILSDGFPEMWWLSIKRNDRECVHDWRVLQEIKNMLIGEENEAVEIYPAESRVVDTANQFHLWVFKDPTIKFPFGFHSGRIIAKEEPITGAKQRPFEEVETDKK